MNILNLKLIGELLNVVFRNLFLCSVSWYNSGLVFVCSEFAKWVYCSVHGFGRLRINILETSS